MFLSAARIIERLTFVLATAAWEMESIKSRELSSTTAHRVFLRGIRAFCLLGFVGLEEWKRSPHNLNQYQV